MASSSNAKIEEIDSNSPTNFNASNCVSAKLDSTILFIYFFLEIEVLNMVQTHGFTGFLDGSIPSPPN